MGVQFICLHDVCFLDFLNNALPDFALETSLCSTTETANAVFEHYIIAWCGIERGVPLLGEVTVVRAVLLGVGQELS
jgi:hypothetical protein